LSSWVTMILSSNMCTSKFILFFIIYIWSSIDVITTFSSRSKKNLGSNVNSNSFWLCCISYWMTLSRIPTNSTSEWSWTLTQLLLSSSLESLKLRTAWNLDRLTNWVSFSNLAKRTQLISISRSGIRW
jgi:hypothetical protein